MPLSTVAAAATATAAKVEQTEGDAALRRRSLLYGLLPSPN
jgi:hypothetical protein